MTFKLFHLLTHKDFWRQRAGGLADDNLLSLKIIIKSYVYAQFVFVGAAYITLFKIKHYYIHSFLYMLSTHTHTHKKGDIM